MIKIKKKNNRVFDSNIQPLDNTICKIKKNTQQIANINLNLIKENGFINNIFKRFKTNNIETKK